MIENVGAPKGKAIHARDIGRMDQEGAEGHLLLIEEDIQVDMGRRDAPDDGEADLLRGSCLGSLGCSIHKLPQWADRLTQAKCLTAACCWTMTQGQGQGW